MQLNITQVTFLEGGEFIVAGSPVGDSTKVVFVKASEALAYAVAMALASGNTGLIGEPPDEDIVEVREL